MEYNLKKIGKRIKDERKKAGYRSQDDLIDALRSKGFCVGRNTISDIETGKTSHYDFDLLVALSELFGCGIGHLLCQYEARSPEAQTVCDITGLTPDAVEKLMWYKNNQFPDYRTLSGISLVLTDETNIMELLLECLSAYGNGKDDNIKIEVMPKGITYDDVFPDLEDVVKNHVLQESKRYESCSITEYKDKGIEIKTTPGADIKINNHYGLTNDLIRQAKLNNLTAAMWKLADQIEAHAWLFEKKKESN